MSKHKRPREQRINDAAEATDAEVAFAKACLRKHGIDPDKPGVDKHVLKIMLSIQFLGFGRNTYTANLLRATADMLVADEIETIESIEARVDGKSS